MASTVYGSTGEEAVKYGLNQAQDWLKNNQSGYNKQYPGYSERKGPATMDYGVQYTSTDPYQKVDGITTNWQQFQEQMRQPVYEAYNQNVNDISGKFSSNGLYGSRGQSLHDDTMVRAGQGLMTGLLNADTMAQDQYLKDAAFRAGQEEAAWKASLLEAERQQAYDTNKFNWDYQMAQQPIDFYNAEAERQDAYNREKFNWDYGQSRQLFNDALALAGGGTPGAQSAASAQAAETAANKQANAAEKQAWIEGGSALGATLLDAWLNSD